MPQRRLDSAAFAELASDILAGDHILRFEATGGSMRPFIWDGDTLEVRAVNPDELRRGDIVLCRLASGRLVAHRVTQVSQSALVTHGDALFAPDGGIAPAAVMGRVCAVTHKAQRYSTNTALIHTLALLWIALVPLRQPLLAGILWGLRLRKWMSTGKTS